MRVIDEEVRQWRREDAIDAVLDLVGRAFLRLVWWVILVGSGYIAGQIMAGGGA